MMEICAGCGQPIEWESKVVAVRYGIIQAAVSHTRVTKGAVDYFHIDCDKAFRNLEVKK